MFVYLEQSDGKPQVLADRITTPFLQNFWAKKISSFSTVVYRDESNREWDIIVVSNKEVCI
jgi:hypothetical protein